MSSYKKLQRLRGKQAGVPFRQIGRFLDAIGPTGFLQGTGRAIDKAFSLPGPAAATPPAAPPAAPVAPPTEPGRAGFGLKSTRPQPAAGNPPITVGAEPGASGQRVYMGDPLGPNEVLGGPGGLPGGAGGPPPTPPPPPAPRGLSSNPLYRGTGNAGSNPMYSASMNQPSVTALAGGHASLGGSMGGGMNSSNQGRLAATGNSAGSMNGPLKMSSYAKLRKQAGLFNKQLEAPIPVLTSIEGPDGQLSQTSETERFTEPRALTRLFSNPTKDMTRAYNEAQWLLNELDAGNYPSNANYPEHGEPEPEQLSPEERDRLFMNLIHANLQLNNPRRYRRISPQTFENHFVGPKEPTKMSAADLAKLHVTASRYKQAGLKQSEGWMDGISNWLAAHPDASNALLGGGIGAGGGALLGGLSSLGQEEEDRNMLGSALTGAMGGGLLGAGAGYAYPKVRDWINQPPETPKPPPSAADVAKGMQGFRPTELPEGAEPGKAFDAATVVKQFKDQGFQSSSQLDDAAKQQLFDLVGRDAERYRQIVEGLDAGPSGLEQTEGFLRDAYTDPWGLGAGAGMHTLNRAADLQHGAAAKLKELKDMGNPGRFSSLQDTAEEIVGNPGGPFRRAGRVLESYQPTWPNGQAGNDLRNIARAGRGTSTLGRAGRVMRGLLPLAVPPALEGLRRWNMGR